MAEFKAGQRVRIEWPDGSAVEGCTYATLTSADRVAHLRGLSWSLNLDTVRKEGATVTILSEPRPEEPTGLGAVVEAGTSRPSYEERPARSAYASRLVEAEQEAIDARREAVLARAEAADAERIAALRLADMAAQTVVTRDSDGTVSARVDDPYGLGWTPVALELVHKWAAIVNEHAALTRWKAEAMAVIEAWEQVHRLLGSPGRVGESKAAATYDAVARLEPGRTRWEARRELLADLRGKVDEALPHDRKCDLLDPAYGGPGKVMCSCGLTDAVLALLEAQQ